MRFVRSNTTIPVPKVLDSWTVPNPLFGEDADPTGYILMEYIEGSTIKELWPDMTTLARAEVAKQLNGYVEQLRTQKSDRPGPVVEDYSFGPFFTDYGAGPWSTTALMEEWFNERLEVCKQFGRSYPDTPKFSADFTELVMCHMDLAARNMILDENGKLWLLDWQFAGAYPPYFEKAALEKCGELHRWEKLPVFDSTTQQESEKIAKLFSIEFALSTAPLAMPNGMPMMYRGKPI